MKPGKNEKLLNIIITGTNKGIGFELVQQICEQQKNDIKYNVIMTSRDQERGQKALAQILQQYPEQKENIHHHLLDVTSKGSIDTFYDWYSKNFSKIYILTSNAAIGNPDDFFNKELQSQQLIDTVLDCNIYGVINLNEKLFPLLADDAKIVIVSSELGKLSFQGEGGQKLLGDPTLTKEKLLEIVENYRKIGTTQEVINQGFSPKSYFFSKAVINSYGRFILKKQMQKNQTALLVHPGWCRTDLGTQKATSSAAQGAEMVKYAMFEIPFGEKEKYNGTFWSCVNRTIPSDF